jgi:hypothetical protein
MMTNDISMGLEMGIGMGMGAFDMNSMHPSMASVVPGMSMPHDEDTLMSNGTRAAYPSFSDPLAQPQFSGVGAWYTG